METPPRTPTKSILRRPDQSVNATPIKSPNREERRLSFDKIRTRLFREKDAHTSTSSEANKHDSTKSNASSHNSQKSIVEEISADDNTPNFVNLNAHIKANDEIQSSINIKIQNTITQLFPHDERAKSFAENILHKHGYNNKTILKLDLSKKALTEEDDIKKARIAQLDKANQRVDTWLQTVSLPDLVTLVRDTAQQYHRDNALAAALFERYLFATIENSHGLFNYESATDLYNGTCKDLTLSSDSFARSFSGNLSVIVDSLNTSTTTTDSNPLWMTWYVLWHHPKLLLPKVGKEALDPQQATVDNLTLLCKKWHENNGQPGKEAADELIDIFSDQKLLAPYYVKPDPTTQRLVFKTREELLHYEAVYGFEGKSGFAEIAMYTTTATLLILMILMATKTIGPILETGNQWAEPISYGFFALLACLSMIASRLFYKARQYQLYQTTQTLTIFCRRNASTLFQPTEDIEAPPENNGILSPLLGNAEHNNHK